MTYFRKFSGPNGLVKSVGSGVYIWDSRNSKLLYKLREQPADPSTEAYRQLETEAFNFVVDGVRLPPDHWIAAE